MRRSVPRMLRAFFGLIVTSAIARPALSVIY
jgi:hypothetical protein